MLGDRISELRSMRSWSQVTLAKRLGVTKQAVSNWENGNIQPSIEMLLRLARLFGVPTDYLLGLENTPYLNTEGVPAEVVAHLSLLVMTAAWSLTFALRLSGVRFVYPERKPVSRPRLPLRTFGLRAPPAH